MSGMRHVGKKHLIVNSAFNSAVMRRLDYLRLIIEKYMHLLICKYLLSTTIKQRVRITIYFHLNFWHNSL